TAEVNARLDALGQIKQAQIEQWTMARVSELTALADGPDVIAAAGALRAGPAPAAAETLSARLDGFAAGHPDFQTLLVADADSGVVLAASAAGAAQVGTPLGGEDFFAPARFGALFAPPRYAPNLNAEALSLAAVAPVIDPQAGTQAILVGLLADTRLLQIVSPAPGLGATGAVYAVSRDGYRLGDLLAPLPPKPDSLGLRRALAEQQNGFAMYANPEGRRVVGSYRWLAGPQLALLVEQDQDEAYQLLTRAGWLIALATALAAAATVAAGLFFARRLVAPIQALTAGAARIAAGDLAAQVAVDRADEVGLLAEAFNQMSRDLRASVASLQQTAEARARQLAAASDLSRTAAARLSLDPLLTRLTDLIAEHFGYDEVALYLLDEAGALAVLREAHGETGEQLKAQGYEVPVGSDTAVGQVTASGEPRLLAPSADEAAGLAVFPLRLGERVIGALELQSRRAEAFQADAVEVLQTLADQIAVAVENSRLFARQQRLLQLEALVISLTNRIHQSYKPEAILESAATELGRALGASRAVVRLYPPTEWPEPRPPTRQP
ncbi:MAG: HAMP domain-containing protein, partial [Anaerolineales bacterium]|nr:HAMP domain-containing protein [Anaerolineales bacterium]